MISNCKFQEKISAFLSQTGMSATKFGAGAMNDPSFVFRLLKGREVRESGKLRCLTFMADYKKTHRKRKSRKKAVKKEA